ncbi:MAG TPA: Holliday junction resolvase RuvX [Cytophagales bacterium]|jgi:putative Holliday junction resolvase
MGRILAIDYGTKRTGLAVTDPLQIIATALDTVRSHDLMAYLKSYAQREPVEAFVVGLPKQLDNSPSAITPQVEAFVKHLQKTFPDTPIHRVDERFTSSMAQQVMIDSGMKKKDRQVKGNVDKISAVIILQSFMAGPGFSR